MELDKIRRAGKWLDSPQRAGRLLLFVAMFAAFIAWSWAVRHFQPIDVFLSLGNLRTLAIDGYAGPPVLYRYRNGELRAWDWISDKDWKLPQPRQWRDLVVGPGVGDRGTVAFYSDDGVVSVTSLKPPFEWNEYRLPKPQARWQFVMISSTADHAVFFESSGRDANDLVVIELATAAVVDRLPCSSHTQIHSSTGEITVSTWLPRVHRIEYEVHRHRLDDQGHWKEVPGVFTGQRGEREGTLIFTGGVPRSVGSKSWWLVFRTREQKRYAEESVERIESSDFGGAVFRGRHSVVLMPADSEVPSAHFANRDRVIAAGFTGDGKHLVVYDQSSTLQVFDAARGRLVAEKSTANSLWLFYAMAGMIGVGAAILAIALACSETSMAWAACDTLIAGAFAVMTSICVNHETVALSSCGFATAVGALLVFAEGDVVSRAARGLWSVAAVAVAGLLPTIATFSIDGYPTKDLAVISCASFMLIASACCMGSAWLAVATSRTIARFMYNPRVSDPHAPRKPFQFTIFRLMGITLVVALLGAAPYWLFERDRFGSIRITVGGALVLGSSMLAAIGGVGLAFLWLRHWTARSTIGIAFLIGGTITAGYAIPGLAALAGTLEESVLIETFHHLAPLLVAAFIPLAVARYKGFRWN